MKKLIYVYLLFLLAILVSGSALLGFMLARTKNIRDSEEFTSFTLDLPSKVLDIRGDLITEYASDEKRELISFNKISPHLVHALIAREDRSFYEHPGFSIKAIARAIIGQVFNKNLGGGSTITQQTSGNLYADRREKSIKRKIIELWWAVQMERRYSKNEIMELYLNKVYFGSGNIHGIEAAARFYCETTAEKLTPAEAAVLVIQLSSPIHNNPFEHPNTARKIQSSVLEQMVKMGYLDSGEAQDSFEQYWANFDYTRTGFSGFLAKDDKAPWFSEYVRRELENLMYGTMNYYTGGYTINTTCDLRHQKIAEKYLLPSIDKANKDVVATNVRDNLLVKKYNNLSALIALCFNLPEIKVDSKRNKVMTLKHYRNKIDPAIDMLSLMFNIQELQIATKRGAARRKVHKKKTTVEGALICFENDTGYITAIIGGSEYNQTNQFIRATQSRISVGSAIKPLYYSAAIDSGAITEGSQLSDTPTVFINNAGVQYIPRNYDGKWRGTVLAYKALALSLNIPAVEVMRRTGFDACIDRMANLADITDPVRIKENFPRVYPLALGFSSFTPLEMAKAYAVFANQGMRVDPIAILNIKDKDGNIILDVEKDLRIAQRKLGSAMQIISPQNAYIMTDMLSYTLRAGSIYGLTNAGNKFTYKDKKTGKYYRIPHSAKTGTTQNWGDVWTIGFSPYYTTAVWLGFDHGDLSLGMNNEAAYLAAPVWANFMYEIHLDKPYKNFIKPETGLEYMQVCQKSGQLMTEHCTDGSIGLYYLTGTAPTEKCTYHESVKNLKDLGVQRIKESLENGKGYDLDNMDSDILMLDPSIFEDTELSSDDTDEFDIEKILESSGVKDLPDTKVEIIPGSQEEHYFPESQKDDLFTHEAPAETENTAPKTEPPQNESDDEYVPDSENPFL